jgi:hypothetical protein
MAQKQVYLRAAEEETMLIYIYIPVPKSPGDISWKGLIQETSPGLNLDKFARVSKNLRDFYCKSGSLSARRQNNEMFSFDWRKPPVSALGTGIYMSILFDSFGHFDWVT